MKNTIIISLFTAILLSCSISDSNDVSPNTTTTEIKDQVLQGTFNNKAFEFKSGSANIVSGDNEKLSITLISDLDTAICSFSSSVSRDRTVFFNVPNAAGKYPLQFSTDLSSAQTVTMYDYDDGKNRNYIASEGSIEIISIDTSGFVEGKLVAAIGDNQVNGKFSATFCK